MKKSITLFLLAFLFSTAYAQDSGNWLAFPNNENHKIDTLTEGKITVNKNDKIESLIQYVGTPHAPETTVKLKGFRVQLYFKNDKEICNQARLKFLSVTENIPAYIQYVAPHYRLRVGNFRTKLDAEKFRDEVSVYFPEAIIVNDAIDLPRLD